MSKHTMKELQYKQRLPLDIKVKMTKQRIREWVKEFGTEGVYISFSGGKDSTVLLHIVREMYPNIPAVFVDTGLEYPEIRAFVKTFDNVKWIKPKMNFKQVIEKYGYPFISKEISGVVGGGVKSLKILKADGIDIHDRDAVLLECAKRFKKEPGQWRKLAQCLGGITRDGEIKSYISAEEKGRYSTIPNKYKFLMDAPFELSDVCCKVMKKAPFHEYEKATGRVGITGQMAQDSAMRMRKWMAHGCNMFDRKEKISNPMAFWTDQDVLKYIKINNIRIAPVYGDVVYVDDQGNYYDYAIDDSKAKMTTTGCERTGCMFCGYGCHMEKGKGRFALMRESHPKQYEYIMRPWNDGGLGYKEIIDYLNGSGNLNIKY